MYADINSRTYTLDSNLLVSAITARTKAIIPACLYSQFADFDANNAIAAKHGMPVIEDASESFGVIYQAKTSRNLSTITCANFFATMSLGCYGDGGQIFTSDEKLAKVIREIARHGQVRRYHQIDVGVNSRLNTIQAAFFLPKRAMINEEMDLRQEVAKRYNYLLVESGIATIPYLEPYSTSPWAQYTMQVANRDEVKTRLDEAGIPTAVHYPNPSNRQPSVADANVVLGVVDEVAEQVISLPMWPMLDDTMQRTVVRSLLGVI